MTWLLPADTGPRHAASGPLGVNRCGNGFEGGEVVRAAAGSKTCSQVAAALAARISADAARPCGDRRYHCRSRIPHRAGTTREAVECGRSLQPYPPPEDLTESTGGLC